MEQENITQEKSGGKKSHKISRLVFFVILVFFLTAVSVIVVDRFLFPYLTTVGWFNKYELFKKATENVVVVNKTEQVTMSEDLTIEKYSNKAAAGVVEIVSEKKQSQQTSRAPSLANSQEKIGSGLIATADGLILTDSEAILTDQATYHVFVSADGAYDARLIAVDSFTGLALLKIDNVSDLPTTSFIAPQDIKVGAKVAAIGRNGSDFQIVYKSGLLSQFAPDFSLAGPVASSEKMQGVYLADFDLSNTGDESMNGGTVANYNGDVVGMLGSLRAANQSQYFIIPVNYLEDLINQYISSGVTQRGILGLYYTNLTRETSYLLGTNIEKGAMVYSPSGQQGLAVITGSAAEKAGIKLFDIVTSVNGEEVSDSQNLAYLISKYKTGDEVELGILRNGQEMKVKVTLQ